MICLWSKVVRDKPVSYITSTCRISLLLILDLRLCPWSCVITMICYSCLWYSYNLLFIVSVLVLYVDTVILKNVTITARSKRLSEPRIKVYISLFNLKFSCFLKCNIIFGNLQSQLNTCYISIIPGLPCDQCIPWR